MLLGKGWRAIHQDEQLYDAADFVEVASGGLQGSEKIDGNGLCCLPSFGGGQVCAEFAGPWLAVRFCDVAGDEKEIAGADEGSEGGDWRVHMGQNYISCFKAFVDGHRNLLIADHRWTDRRFYRTRAELYCGGVGSAEHDADAFTGFGLVAAGEQRGEGGGASRLGDYAQDAPKRFLRLRDFLIVNEAYFFNAVLRYGEHKFADTFWGEGIGGDSSSGAVYRASRV